MRRIVIAVAIRSMIVAVFLVLYARVREVLAVRWTWCRGGGGRVLPRWVSPPLTLVGLIARRVDRAPLCLSVARR